MHLVEKFCRDRKARSVTEYTVDVTARTHGRGPASVGSVINPPVNLAWCEMGAAMETPAKVARLDLSSMMDRSPMSVSDSLREALNRIDIVGLPHGSARPTYRC